MKTEYLEVLMVMLELEEIGLSAEEIRGYLDFFYSEEDGGFE